MRMPSTREVKEARSRSHDYAEYYIRTYGDAAVPALRRKIACQRLFSYYGLLYRLALREVRRRRRGSN